MDNYNSLQEEKEPDDLMKENIIRRNKKKIAQGGELPGKSMLKKSDLSLVFIGAGIITLIIFFLFLRPSDDATTEIEEDKSISETAEPGVPAVDERVNTLEQKLTTLEEMLQAINAAQSGGAQGEPGALMQDIKPYVARIERVETALSVKFDVLTARVDKLDDKLSDIIKDVEKNSRLASNIKHSPPSHSQPSKNSEPQVVKQATPKKVTPEAAAPAKVSSKVQDQKTVNKTAASTKPENISSVKAKPQKTDTKVDTVYHTVAKGDTLYNISKRYDTTVEKLRAMNKMTIQDAIVIGQKLVVKQ